MFIPNPIVFLLSIVFYIGTIIVHYLVIKKVIPYTYVNGGRSKSYEDQLKQSTMSIVILGLGFLFVLSGLFFPSLRKQIVFMLLSFLLALLWGFGTILQLIGTKFERLCF